MVHHGHTWRDALADHRTSGKGAISVEGFNPVRYLQYPIHGHHGFALIEQSARHRATTRSASAGFRCRWSEFTHFWCGVRKLSAFRETVGRNFAAFCDAAGIEIGGRYAAGTSPKARASTHDPDRVICRPTTCATGDQFMYVGIAGVIRRHARFPALTEVGLGFVARLRTDITTGTLIFFIDGQMSC